MEESGESLEAAKRYYGSYLMLLEMMDRLQTKFVADIEDERLPELGRLGERAQELIAEARHNARTGGDPAIAAQNEKSNRLTLQASELYAAYLREQADAIRAANRKLQLDLRDAGNTYDTVVLSSQVSELLKDGERSFSALLALRIPELRGFENAELRQEFERLTNRLEGKD